MQKSFYFLSPVEVVKVTSQNLEEVAKWCGGKVAETESRRVPGRMDKYVWVPTPKGSNISWAFPGMFVTKRLVVTVKDGLKATWAVFSRDYFEKNYFESPKVAVDKTWEREAAEKVKPAEVVVNVSVADAMSDALEKVKTNVEEIAKAGNIELPDEWSTEVAESVLGLRSDPKAAVMLREMGKKIGKPLGAQQAAIESPNPERTITDEELDRISREVIEGPERERAEAIDTGDGEIDEDGKKVITG